MTGRYQRNGVKWKIWLSLSAIVFASILPSKSVAQYTSLKFENISTTQGLSSSTCTDLFQDKQGFLWVGTIDGLNKYNGYDFKVYRPILGDKYSISNNRITTITEDNDERLWIGTTNGLNVLDKGTGRFYRFFHGSSDGTISNNFVTHLLFDSAKNILWIGTRSGLDRVNLTGLRSNAQVSQVKFKRYVSNPIDKRSIDHNNITRIISDHRGNIWVATFGQSLNRYEETGDNFERVKIDIKNTFELNHLPKLLMEDDEGNFWIGNDLSRIVVWNRNQNSFELKSFTPSPTPIFHLYRDGKGSVWAATDGDGLYIKYKGVERVEHIRSTPNVPNSLPNNQPSKVLEDKNGIIWIASYNTGISKLTVSASAFGLYYHQEGNGKSLSTSIAQSVFEDSKGRVWVGTDGGGLNLLNEDQKLFKHYRHNPKNTNSISSDKILYVTENHKGELVVCTWDGGVNFFDPETNTVRRHLHGYKDSSSLGNNTVWHAVEDNQKRLWLATQTSGLNYYDYKSNRFYKFTSDEKDSTTLVNNNAIAVFVDSKNRLLVGTASGLSWTNLNDLPESFPRKMIFRSIKALDGIRINHLAEDAGGNILIGADLGLFKLDKGLNVSSTFTTKQGLPNSLITAVVEDNDHNIWVTSKGGLSKLDPSSNQFTNFNVSDGIQGLEFQAKSIEKRKDGRILIGGINGLNVFDPAKILAVVPKPVLIITDLKIANESISVNDTVNGRILLTEPIEKTKDITLRHNENYISFEYLALNYSNPQKSQYAYRIVGLDKDWNFVRDRRSVTYSNLASGKYQFEVMASADGNWDESKAASISLHVLPPPWGTWWAYSLYAIATALAIFYSLKYYTNRVREEKKHEVDQAKLSFFINVSHEFRTPLTLILNPIDKILSSYTDPEEVKASALIIQRSGRRLLNLVNQLLDLRKTDLGKSPVETVKGDFVQFAKDLFNLFSDFARVKGIEFQFDSSVEQLQTYFDPDKIEKILTNLLSNAIKFTNAGGKVTLSIAKKHGQIKHTFKNILTRGSVDFIEVRVIDTGIGLSPEQLHRIFERFFHVDNSKSGTGIGLHFTKSLVELHDGEIDVESVEGKGTIFKVKLPIMEKPYKRVENLHHSNLANYNYDATSIKSIEYELAIDNGHEDESIIDPANTSGDVEKKPVLLIVEDNRELRQHLKNELKKDFKIREAVNGVDGLEKVLKFFPDIIISDIMMPEMDGFELCRRIKTDIDTSHIPTVLLTARNLEEDKIEGYQTGADEYLPKPFNVHVLRARLRNLLDSRQRLKEKFLNSGVLPAKEVTTNTLDEVFLDKVTKAILENISDPDFSLESLLEKVGISRSHFFRKINSLTGQNPSNFIRTVRLKYATGLLIQNQYSIKEISYMSGFNSSAYFSKTFRELFGKTPQQYIEEHQKSPK